MKPNAIPCPFVYANGRHCPGVVCQVRAYGPTRGGDYIDLADVRKFRLWCSDKNDHAGAIPSFTSKQRMEFYPDELVRLGIYDQAIACCEEVGIIAPAPNSPGSEGFDSRTPEHREAEALNEKVRQLWPDEWQATRMMSVNTARKHRKALRARAAKIDQKNAWNARYTPP